MDSNQNSAILKHYQSLVRGVKEYNIVPELVEKGVLTDEDVERVKAHLTDQEKMQRLIGFILNSKKKRIFEIFLDSLRNNLQEHLAEDIVNTLRVIDNDSERQGRDRLLRTQSGPTFRQAATEPTPETAAPATRGSIQSDGALVRMDSRSYDVPEKESDLYFILINKPKDRLHEGCGIQVEKHCQIAGFAVVNISQGSPASQTDLQKFDVIRTIGGVDMRSKNEKEVVNMFFANQECIVLGIVRFGYRIMKSKQKISLKAELSQTYGLSFIDGPRAPRFSGDSDYYINKVTPGGIACRLGLRVGDTLINVNGKPLKGLKTLGDVQRKLAPELANPKGAELTIERNEFVQI